MQPLPEEILLVAVLECGKVLPIWHFWFCIGWSKNEKTKAAIPRRTPKGLLDRP
jgi:hypothetical protein